METQQFLPNTLSNITEVHEILKNFRKPALNELNKNSLWALLDGFRLIVGEFEINKNEADYKTALQWLRLYMKIYIQMSTCEKRFAQFSKTVPIAITYIMGWMQHGPTENPKFTVEVLQVTYKLISLLDPIKIRTLEKNFDGINYVLFLNMKKVGQFSIQMQILHLFILILKKCNDDIAYWGVQNIADLHSDEIKYKLLDLKQMNNTESDFKNLARKILNLYNLKEQEKSLVQSFNCKNIFIGNKYKFLKPINAERFWFDINSNPRTLSFEGRVSLEGKRKYENVDVNLEIENMYISFGKLVIEFGSDPKISTDCKNEIFKEAGKATIVMSEAELNRFEKIFKVLGNTKGKSTPPVKRNSSKSFTINKVDTALKGKDTTAPFTSKQKNSKRNFAYVEFEFDNTQKNQRISDVYDIDVSDSKVITAPLTSKQSKSERNFANVEFGSDSTPKNKLGDVYDDIDVSDAEPCQSYKFFKTRNITSRNVNPISSAQLKRKYSQEHCEKPPKRAKAINNNNYDGPSPSKGIISRVLTGKDSFELNTFDKLKIDSPIQKAAHQAPITKSNDITKQPKSDDEISIIETADPEIYSIDIKKSYNEATSSSCKRPILTSQLLNNNTALVNYNIPKRSYKKVENDSVVYCQRSDDESSDNSDTELNKRPKRSRNFASNDLQLSELSMQMNPEILNLAYDCDTMEIIYISQRKCLSNLDNADVDITVNTYTKKSLHSFRGGVNADSNE